MGTHKFFKDYKLHSPYAVVQFFVVFEKFARVYLFQTALEIIWLPIQTINRIAYWYLKDVRAQISHVQIFLKLWLQVENDKIILKT